MAIPSHDFQPFLQKCKPHLFHRFLQPITQLDFVPDGTRVGPQDDLVGLKVSRAVPILFTVAVLLCPGMEPLLCRCATSDGFTPYLTNFVRFDFIRLVQAVYVLETTPFTKVAAVPLLPGYSQTYRALRHAKQARQGSYARLVCVVLSQCWGKGKGKGKG